MWDRTLSFSTKCYKPKNPINNNLNIKQRQSKVNATTTTNILLLATVFLFATAQLTVAEPITTTNTTSSATNATIKTTGIETNIMDNFNNSLANDRNTHTNKSLKNDHFTNSTNDTNDASDPKNVLNLDSERIRWQKRCTEYDWSIEKGW